MATPLDQFINFFVNVRNADSLKGLAGLFGRLQKSMVSVGVTTIFLDRFVQSLTRAWGALNNTLGVVRLGETGQKILRMADFMEIGTDKLQAFDAAMSTLGKDTDFTRDLLQTFNERVSDISSVQGIADDFARIGLSARDFADSEDAIDRFMVFADQLQKVSAKQRMTAVEAILGGDLSVAGQLGSAEEILDLMQQAIDKGQIFSRQQLEVASSFKRAFHSVGKTLTALSNNIGSTLMPVLIRVAKLIEYVAGEVSATINRRNRELAESVEEDVDGTIGKLEYFFKWWDENVKDLGDTFLRLVPGFATIALVLAAFTSFSWIAALFTGLAAALLLSAALDDVSEHLKGQPSLIGPLIGKYKELRLENKIIAGSFSLLSDQLKSLGNQVTESTWLDTLDRVFGKDGSLAIGLGILVAGVQTFVLAFGQAVFGLAEILFHLLGFVIEIAKFLFYVGGLIGAVGVGYFTDGEKTAGIDSALKGVFGSAGNLGAISLNVAGAGRAMLGMKREIGSETIYETAFNIYTSDPQGAMETAGAVNNRQIRATQGN